jgi:hypothetical protein
VKNLNPAPPVRKTLPFVTVTGVVTLFVIEEVDETGLNPQVNPPAVVIRLRVIEVKPELL